VLYIFEFSIALSKQNNKNKINVQYLSILRAQFLAYTYGMSCFFKLF
jgi:hypothetical protein